MTRTPKLLLVGGAAASLALAGWRLLPARRADPIALETAPVTRGSVVARVTATGTLSALVTVQVGTQVSGRVAALHADFNSKVAKGQLLAVIDPQPFEVSVEQARAAAVSAEGTLDKAEAQARDAVRQRERSRELLERKLVAQADYDTLEAADEGARAQVKVARGGLLQAKAALHLAEVNLANTRIVSPISGVVVSRSVDVGQTVAASLQAPTVFVIAEDLARMQVDTSVAEADVGKLKAGMPASFTVDAYPGRAFAGTVRQVRYAAQTVQSVVTYDAVIDVANPELVLIPGMTASVTLEQGRRDGALLLPNAALRYRPAQGALEAPPPPPGPSPGSPGESAVRSDRRLVHALRQGRPVPVAVRTGLTDGSQSELLEGELREGDPVVVDDGVDRTGGASPTSRALIGGGPGGPPPPPPPSP